MSETKDLVEKLESEGGEMNRRLPNQKIVAIYAEDWSIEKGPINIHFPFTFYSAWITGFLIRETENSVTICMEIFDDNDVRTIHTVPKSGIRHMITIKETTEE